MTPTLAPVPDLDPSLLAEHAASHTDLEAALVAAPPHLGRLLTRLANRLMIGAIANVRPSSRGGSSPALFPVPRSFLSRTDRARLAGTAAGYRYIDSRLAVVGLGIEPPPALLPETPYVLNALTEGRMDNPDEMNPGMIRAVELPGTLPVAAYAPAARGECRGRLDEAVAVAVDTRAPAVARAAWMLHVIGEIHPFGDGNGRVARLLYLLIAGEAMPRTVDWGVVEQLRYHQDTWSETLKEADVTPCAVATTELSIAGARLMVARLEALGRLHDVLTGQVGLPDESATLALAVWLRRCGALDDVADDAQVPYGHALAEAERLAAAGVLRRCRHDADRLPARPGYATSELVDRMLAQGAVDLPAA
jgi:hypothetical protein